MIIFKYVKQTRVWWNVITDSHSSLWRNTLYIWQKWIP